MLCIFNVHFDLVWIHSGLMKLSLMCGGHLTLTGTREGIVL